MRYRTLFTGVLVVALAVVSCSKDDVVEQAAGDPYPQGMAVLATAAATAGVTAITNVVSQVAVDPPQVLQQIRPASVAIGVFPEGNPDCDAGGATIDGTAPGALTATFNNCQSGAYIINATATINVPAVTTCTEDTVSHEVPDSLTAIVNGTINIDGVVVTLTNFGVEITDPVYSTGTGGTCALLQGDIDATGTLSQTISGQTTTIDLGSGSLFVKFDDHSGYTDILNLSGTLSIDTLCTDGGFSLTIATTAPPIRVNDGDTKPSSGTITANGQTVDFATNPQAVPCDGLL